MAFAKVNKPLSLEDNWWILNPWMTKYQPFSKLYNRDKSEDKTVSSNEMYVIFIMNDPDEDLNIFYRIPEEERLEMLKEEFGVEADMDDEIFAQCYDAWSWECLTAVERAFKIEKDQLIKRSKLIKETDLTLDRTQIIGDKSVTIKGTASQINTLQKDFPKIMQQYEEVEQRFIKEKQKIHVKGGSKLSKAEGKNFW